MRSRVFVFFKEGSVSIRLYSLALFLFAALLSGCVSGGNTQVEGQPTSGSGSGSATIGGGAAVPPPVIGDIAPRSGPASGGTTITINGSNFQSGATVKVGGKNATMVVFVSPSRLTAVTPANVAGTVEVQVINPDGQRAVSLRAFTYDPLPTPSVLTLLPVSGPTSGGTSVTINGQNFQSGAMVLIGGTAATSVTVNSANQIQATTPAAPAGTVAVTVINPDSQSGALPNAFTYIASLAPTVATVAPASGPTAGGTTIMITGANFQPGATVLLGNTAALSVVVNSPTQIQAVTPARASGAVDVTVRNPDNQSGTLPLSFIFVLPPSISGVAPGTGTTAGGTSVVITGSNFQTGAAVAFGGTAATSAVVNTATQITAVTATAPAGTVAVRVTNPDNQAGTLPNGFTYLAPSLVISVNPSSGPAAGGTTVIIIGSNFQAGAAVLFESAAAASVTVNSATQITAVTPAHAAGAVTVTVNNPSGTFGSLANGFTFVAPPVVGSVAPNSGPAAGGTSVTITGFGFQTGATVRLGATLATSVSVTSSTQITAVTPGGAAGAVSVQVTNPDGQSGTLSGGFTYVQLPAPSIIGVAPGSGPSAGGTTVTISGANFQSGATVRFGATLATSVTFNSATQLTGVTPPGAGSADVQVTNPDLQSFTLTGGFVYIVPPAPTSVAPNQGPASGGTFVTINGTGFQAGATVTFGAVAATSVNFVSATQLTVLTPAGTAGAVTVRVTNPDSQFGTLLNGFTYVAPPDAQMISPTTGDTGGSVSVTITGTGFQAGALVFFDSALASSVVVTGSTQITALTPPRAPGVVNVTVRNPDNQQDMLVGAFTYTAAAVVPTITSVMPGAGPTSGGTVVTILGTSFVSGATAWFGGTMATLTTFVSATQVDAVTPMQVAGTVDVSVRNPSGSTGTLSNSFVFQAPPFISTVSPNTGPVGGGTSVIITGANFQSGATVSFGGTLSGTVTFNNSTQLTAVAPAGAGTVSVQVTNPDTQSGTLPSAFTYIPPPDAVTAAPASGPTSGGTLVTITGTGFQAGAVVLFGAMPASSVTVLSATQISAVAPAGSGTVNLLVRNPDNQSDTLANAFTFVPPPVVNSAAPPSGPTAGGTAVTISGTGFQAGAVVTFGGANATGVMVISAVQIQAVTPMVSAGSVNVTVRNPDNQSGTLAGGFTFVAAPSISSVTPNTGRLAGGDMVTISGAAFQSGATVTFGGTPATSVMFSSATQLIAVTPAHAAGAVTVQVTNPDNQTGTLINGFTYSPAPSVSTVTPTGGALAGGTDVIVIGSNFQNGAMVLFGGVAASNVIFNSSSNLEMQSPAHAAGTVDVQVRNPDGQTGTLVNAYTYSPPPTISLISPNSGPATGGTIVTLTGAGFQMNAVVNFGALPASAVTVSSTTQIVATAPAATPGTVNVSVINDDGQTTVVTNGYSYISTAPAPIVSSVSPNAGTQGGGTLVTILGQNFQTGAQVRFAAAQATSVTVLSAQQITCVTPPNPDGPADVSVTNPDAQTGILAAGFIYLLASVQIVTDDLPVGQVGIPYGAAFTAAGGAAPYRWTIALGSLPLGLSLNSSTGVISGMATQAGNFTFTVQAADASSPAPQTAAVVLTLTVNVIAAVPGPAELPRVFLNTAMPTQTGAVIRVAAGGNLQAAINSATCGDTIRLASGATFTGNFTLPNKPCSTGFIVIRTDVPDSSLPPEGTRITPAFAPILAKIRTVNTAAAVRANVGAHHYRFTGLMFFVDDTISGSGGVIRLDTVPDPATVADLPHDIVFDRIIVRGNVNGNIRRGININAANVAVIDSYIFEIHEFGADTQAIGAWCGTGPFKIVNNYLEAAGENILFGGAFCPLPGLIQSDLEIRRNHFFKPRSWRLADPTFAGNDWLVKNIFEIKNAQRVLLEGNIFENNWTSGQTGIAINLKASTQSGGMPQVTCQDITFRYNIVRHATGGMSFLGVDSADPNGLQRLFRFNIHDNIFDDISNFWGTLNNLFQVIAGAHNLTMNHNTGLQTPGGIMVADPGRGPFSNSLIWTNNIFRNDSTGFKGSGQTQGIATLNLYFPGFIYTNNVQPDLPGIVSRYPPNNFFPATINDVGFVNLLGGNFRLALGTPFKNAGTDGKDIGARVGATEAATAGVIVP